MGAEGALVSSLGGLVDGAGLLGDNVNALLALSGDTNGLVVDETGVLVNMLASLCFPAFILPALVHRGSGGSAVPCGSSCWPGSEGRGRAGHHRPRYA